MSKRDELINYVASLTPEQVDKVMRRLPMFKQIEGMSENESLFAERFLSRVCGKEPA